MMFTQRMTNNNSLNPVMEETLLQEIQTKINLIIAKAMIVTCDEGIADPCSIYDDRRFIDLVIQPLLELAFIEQGDDLNNQSYSANELLKYFIDLVCAGWKNTCSVCERDFSCTLCQELPKGQTTLTQSSNQAEEGDICNGSNWGPVKNVFEPVPSKNDMINDTKPIPYVFIKRLKIILRSLFGFLEIICCQDQGLEERVEKWIFMNASVENIYGSYDNEAHIQNLDIDGLLTKARKHCVVLFESRTEDPQNTEIVLLNSNIQLQDPSLFLNAESCGYLCIKLLDYKYEGYEICGKIESFIRTCLPDSGIFCRVIKTCTLFLIKLSCTFMRFIKVTCLATSELHDIVPEILFKETSLPDNLFFNKGLYMGLRQHGYKILLDTILSFDKGSKYIARYYLKIFHMLFITILDDNNIRNYIFDITSKFMESPTLVVYLIENGFLSMFVDFISAVLNRIRLRRGLIADLDKIYIRISQRELLYFYEIIQRFSRILSPPESLTSESSDLLKREVRKAGCQLIRLCAGLDKIKMSHIKRDSPPNILNYKQFCHFIQKLYIILCNYFSWLITFEDIVGEIIDEFIINFKINTSELVVKLSENETISKFIQFQSIREKPFLIYNMSQRLFYDVVSRCSANNILPLTLKRLIFDDIPLMMGCSQAAITAFSFEMGCFENVNGKVVFSWRYGQPVPFQHIFIQDFSAIQCMMSLLNHDIFLKYLLFNFFPVLATKATFSHSLADIFSIVPFSNDQLQKFIVFLYNALTERHFVGKLNNPASYLMERRIIHFLAPKERTLSEMKKFLKSCCMTCETFTNISEASSVNEILNNLSYTPKVANQVDRYSLVLRYYSYVNPFYFLNDSVNTQELHAKLHSLHFRKGYTFQIPPIVELQDHFRYINDFLFSSVFFDLIITAFIRWYISPLVSRSLLDHLLLAAMMCLCFILKLSQDPKINTEYLERKLFWFGRHKLLGNQSFLEVLIAEHHSIQNPITHSAVSYYIELSNLPR